MYTSHRSFVYVRLSSVGVLTKGRTDPLGDACCEREINDPSVLTLFPHQPHTTRYFGKLANEKRT